MNKKSLEQFTGKYPISKTLRFALTDPEGDTKKFIEDIRKGQLQKILEEDKQRAKDYKEVKEIINEYHQKFIEEVLGQKDILTEEDINKYVSAYSAFKKPAQDTKDREKVINNKQEIEEKLRKTIAGKFAKHSNYKEIFEKELIQKLLPQWLEQRKNQKELSKEEYDKQKALVEKFNKFTTYFTGFHQNRKNMYESGDKASAIAYRIVNVNFSKFLDNHINYTKILGDYSDIDFSSLEKDLKAELQGYSLTEFMSPNNFINCFTQSGIDNYNTIIGGKVLENGKKIQGINEIINEYKMRLAQKDKQKAKKTHPMVELYKQILSDRTSHSFLSKQFGSDTEMLEAINEFYNHINNPKEEEKLSLLDKIKQFLNELSTEKFNTEGIYIKGANVRKISNTLFHDWGLIGRALEHYTEKKPRTKTQEEDMGKWLEKNVFSIDEIERALEKYKADFDNEDIKEKLNNRPSIMAYFNKAEKASEAEDQKNTNIFEAIEQSYEKAKDVLELKILNKNRSGKEGAQQIEKIKTLLDAIKDLLDFIRPLYLEHNRKKIDVADKDHQFYAVLDPLYEELADVIGLYNKVRNYVTKRNLSAEKFKVNFERSTLLDGWDVNKETDNLAVLLRKGANYYLGITHSKHSNILDYVKSFNDYLNPNSKQSQRKDSLREKIIAKQNEYYYEKMVYKFLPNPNRMLPKVFFSDSRKSYFNPPQEIEDIGEKVRENEDLTKSEIHKLIDFYKTCLKKHPDWRQFNFRFSPTESYDTRHEFFSEIEGQNYQIHFDKIKASYIKEKIDKGELFLFKIYNKDFSPHSKGKPNLHTSFWQLLFDEKNLTNPIAKLNGEAEIFFRPASIKEKDAFIHKKNKPIKNKNKDNTKKESTFQYDIIKDKRYTQDKLFFHVPITLNFSTQELTAKEFNLEVNSFLRRNPSINIIGIDRGERNLLYYTVINQQGEILEQESLNIVTTKIPNQKNQIEVDYFNILNNKEVERDEARKSWTTIENIKELKSGYLSQVIHKLANLMIKYNAIVVLEDLNIGFKRMRFKVEKQVYQKFEKTLIDKLNYLVFKDRKWGEAGHYLTAYQLATKFTSFSKLGKQNGFLFYIPAANTSKIDPTTGFAPRLYPRYDNREKSREWLGCFSKVKYNPSNDYFEFTFNYDAFRGLLQNNPMPSKDWTVCTYGKERYRYNPKTKSIEEHDITKDIKKLLEKYEISYSEGEDLLDSINSIDEAAFYRKLLLYLSIILQLRYTNGEEDFILSPIKNEKGDFFDSRKITNKSMPQDADANGAYHIALKGLWVLQKINNTEEKDLDNLSKSKQLSLTLQEWFKFAQEKPYAK